MYIYRDGGQLLAAAIWVQKKWDDYATYYGMTADEYVQRRRDFGEKGLAVTTFCAYVDGGQWRYSAIWEKVAGSWPHWFNMSSDGYQQNTTGTPARATASTRSRPTATSTPPSGRSRR